MEFFKTHYALYSKKYYIQQIETHYVFYYGWGLTPISKFKVNCLTYIIAGIQ